MSLNPAQRDAVNTLSGPMLVLAGAGTGKTRVVMQRVVNLIRHGTRPGRILAVTFTNKAAREMQERAGKLLRNTRAEEKPEISTFHSLCVRILRRRIDRLGYPPRFAIYDRGDQESVARGALREVKIAETALRPGDVIQFISGWKTSGLDPAQAARQARSDKEHLAASVYRRYQNTLKTVGAVDFDDLLCLTTKLFARFPEIREAEAARFDHVMIDEYQDTNDNQYQLVKALAAGHRNLCVVGDDDQSIYGWRGAKVTHILRFKQDWPEAKVVRLETNYRSTQPIIEWANRLIAFNTLRHGKTLRTTTDGDKPRITQLPDEAAEAEFVVDEIKRAVDARRYHYGDFAVLFRTNEQPRVFEEEFRRKKVPYVLVGGTSFFDRKEIRDVLAYLKVLVFPRDDVSLLRVINTPPRGIGQTTVKRLVTAALARHKPVWEMLGDAPLSFGAAGAVGRFRELISKYRRASKTGNLKELVAGLIHEIGYRDELSRLYNNPNEFEARWRSVEEVINSVAAYVRRERSPTLAGFVHELALGDRDIEPDKESKIAGNAVVLMTLHSAKGLEFPAVYMVGMEEGLLPHRRSIDEADSTVDEERRLCYVGMTRAERQLTLTLALNRMKWGKMRPTIPSRFLYEMTGQADNPNYGRSIRGETPKPGGPPKPHSRKPGSPKAGSRKPHSRKTEPRP
ncbi:MAG: UvrD-helicase domain-containing protein [Pirellulales bacterium]|nr:UvrD-helicase domain-containing protein [Pirellulales bacterium]